MSRIKVLIVLGTRPEAIKLAPIIYRMKKRPDKFDLRICVTAQHREMLDQVLSIFDIHPEYDLNIMEANQMLSKLTAELIRRLDPVINKENPHWVLVQGDTTTTMAASVLAFYQKIKVGHVEAGLRSYDKRQPFPEEVNRRLTSVIADLHFAPTETARCNLLSENISDDQIIVTGNTVVDALQIVLKKPFNIRSKTFRGIDWDKRIILVTAHRRENFGKKIQEICNAVKEIAQQHRDVQIVWPVHLNPNIREPVLSSLANTSRILILPPIDYLSFCQVAARAYFLLTDSGGLQEEAPTLGKPVLVMRNKTERPEGVECGVAKLVGTNRKMIVNQCSLLLDQENIYKSMVSSSNPYGDGAASKRIINAIMQHS